MVCPEPPFNVSLRKETDSTEDFTQLTSCGAWWEPSPLNKEVGWETFVSLAPSCPEVLEPSDCPLLCMVCVMLAALSLLPWGLECD